MPCESRPTVFVVPKGDHQFVEHLYEKYVSTDEFCAKNEAYIRVLEAREARLVGSFREAESRQAGSDNMEARVIGGSGGQEG